MGSASTQIWTIQPQAVCSALEKDRELFVDQRCPRYRGYVPAAYRWLQKQLRPRLQGYTGKLPWWAYCSKPDLRLHRHVWPKASVQVRLELHVSVDEVTRFPCWAWHTVFRQDYLAMTREEYEEWTARQRAAVPDEDLWPPPEPWRSQLEASWERLFSPDLPQLSWNDETVWSKQVCMEAVFEILRWDDVRDATTFRGTSPFLAQASPLAYLDTRESKRGRCEI